MDENKTEAIKNRIKEAKDNNLKIEEYLSEGDPFYANAISSIRTVGILAAIPACWNILIYAFSLLITFPTLVGSVALGSVNAAYLGVGIILYVGLMLTVITINIFQLIYCYNLRKLSKKPSKLKHHLITILILSLLSQIFGFINATHVGLIVVPSVLAIITILELINALFTFKSFEEWYEQFKCPTKNAKKRVSKELNKGQHYQEEHKKTDDNEYDDDL